MIIKVSSEFQFHCPLCNGSLASSPPDLTTCLLHNLTLDQLNPQPLTLPPDLLTTWPHHLSPLHLTSSQFEIITPDIPHHLTSQFDNPHQLIPLQSEFSPPDLLWLHQRLILSLPDPLNTYLLTTWPPLSPDPLIIHLFTSWPYHLTSSPPDLLIIWPLHYLTSSPPNLNPDSLTIWDPHNHHLLTPQKPSPSVCSLQSLPLALYCGPEAFQWTDPQNFPHYSLKTPWLKWPSIVLQAYFQKPVYKNIKIYNIQFVKLRSWSFT